MAKEVLPGQLRINDIIFDVPPQNIQVVKREHNLSIPTLRSTSSTKIKSGTKEVLFVIDLLFATGFNYALGQKQLALDVINRQLAPLIIQTRKNPFCSIENEKIRKEMAGELSDGEFVPKNMGGCIKSIRITTDGSSPELLAVQIVIKWFNYLPYTPTFTYLSDPTFRAAKNQDFTFDQLQDLSAAGRIKSADTVNSPEDSHYYKLFYQNGTMQEDHLGNARFINEISDISNGMEFIYKEYREATGAASSSSDWTTLSTKELLGRDLEYRYRSFKVSPDDVRNKSGALVPLSLEMTIETKVPALTLLGHSIPTLQFLGVSDAVVNISFFANAELNGETPVESSKQLGSLSRVLEKVIHNSIKYRVVSRRDPIFVRHPLLKLMNYDLFTDQKTKIVYTDDSGRAIPVEFGEVVPCIVNSVDTNTLPQAPFCNKIDIQLIESYRKTSGDTRLKNQGMGRNIFESLTEGLIESAKFFEFEVNEETGLFVSKKKVSEDWVNSRSRPLLVNLRRVLNKKKDISTDPIEVIKSFESDPELSGDIELLTNLVANYALELKPSFLSKLSDDLASTNTTSPETAYPDMKLPRDLNNPGREAVGMNPDFFWTNFSDITFPETQKTGAKIAFDHFNEIYVDKLKKITNQQKVEELVSTRVMAGKAPPPVVKNGTHTPESTGNTASKDAAHSFTQSAQSLTLAATLRGLKDNTYTMRRSMPTFKLYFLNDRSSIDKTESKNVWLNFEDFYSVNSIKEIRLIKTKELAADTLILQLTNLDEDLVNKDFPFVTKGGKTKVSYGQIDGELVSTQPLIPRKLDKFDNLMLNEGTRVQLRLGYDSDPDKLAIEFNGRITQVSGSDVLELVCQSHAIELELEEKGVESKGEEFSFNSETNDLIAKLIDNSPEIASFGNRGINTFFGETSFLGKFLGGASLSDNLFAPQMGYSASTVAAESLITGATFGSILPLVGTIVGGVIGGLVGAFRGVLNLVFKVPFVVYQQTIWDVVKELELRHTDCVSGVVPYDTRMTLFFGYPEQLYFYRGYAPSQTASGKKTLGQKFTQRDDLNKLSGRLGVDPNLFSQRAGSEFRELGPGAGDELDKLLQYMKPFRNYHMVTSEHDIVYNNIRADLEGTYNSVKVFYPKSGGELNLDGSVGFEKYQEFKTMADDDLSKVPNFIRTGTFVQHNAQKWGNVDLPKAYSVSLLKRSLADLYKGELGLLGRPEIKPWDIVFIFDSYNGIFGVVEVKQVIQTLSYETGWITEIVPNMVIFTNNIAGRAHLEAISLVYGAQYTKNATLYHASKFDLDAIEPDESSAENTSTSEAATGALSILATNKALRSTGTLFKDKLNTGAFALTKFGEKGLETSILKGTGAIAKTAGGAAVRIGAAIFGDNLVDELISWAELREPLIFVPLKRNGVPWTLGLYGLRPDSLIDSIKEDGGDLYGRGRLAFGRLVTKIIGHDFGL